MVIGIVESLQNYNEKKREEFVEFLSDFNHSCGCEYLSEFFSIEDKAVHYSKIAYDLHEKYSFNEKIENPEIKEMYEEAIENYVSKLKDYNLLLGKLVEEDKLELFLHKDKNETLKVPNKNLVDLLDNREVITFHCKECHSQLGILGVHQDSQ